MNKDDYSKAYLKLNKIHRELKWLSYSYMNDAELKDKIPEAAKQVKEMLEILKVRIEK